MLVFELGRCTHILQVFLAFLQNSTEIPPVVLLLFLNKKIILLEGQTGGVVFES